MAIQKEKYDGTKHNIGFSAITALSDAYNIPVNTREHKALCGKGYIEGQKVLLAMPLTYMNLSGESIRELVDYYKINPEEELIIIYDDINWHQENCAYVPKAVQEGIMALKI